ncbi:MAG: hypothetical protein JWO53_1140 [Chlamydiia bacterium]|nr:hypothetical protein [Chlamydiia bacterium]
MSDIVISSDIQSNNEKVRQPPGNNIIKSANSVGKQDTTGAVDARIWGSHSVTACTPPIQNEQQTAKVVHLEYALLIENVSDENLQHDDELSNHTIQSLYVSQEMAQDKVTDQRYAKPVAVAKSIEHVVLESALSSEVGQVKATPLPFIDAAADEEGPTGIITEELSLEDLEREIDNSRQRGQTIRSKEEEFATTRGRREGVGSQSERVVSDLQEMSTDECALYIKNLSVSERRHLHQTVLSMKNVPSSERVIKQVEETIQNTVFQAVLDEIAKKSQEVTGKMEGSSLKDMSALQNAFRQDAIRTIRKAVSPMVAKEMDAANKNQLLIAIWNQIFAFIRSK